MATKKNAAPRPPVRTLELWVEVANIRFVTERDGGEPTLEVQIKGQRTDADEMSWWRVLSSKIDASQYFKVVTEALDKKRLAYVRITADGGVIIVDALRLDYAT